MRTLSVSYLPNMGESAWKPQGVPYIRMRGHWLRAAGFEIGNKIVVSVEAGKLTLVKKEASCPTV